MTLDTANNSQSGITPQQTMELSAHIDWIAVTAKHEILRENEHRLILADDYVNGFETTRATNGYNVARRYQSGAIMQWHTKHIEMGVHTTYSAQALRHAAENFNLSQDEILGALTAFGRVSRLDVCLDVANVQIDIRKLHQDAVQGKIKTRAKTFDYVESAKRGQEIGARTTYIGSMHKRKKLLRIYDKGMQLNLENYLTRFELEQHGAIANNAAKLLLQSPNMGADIAGMIKGYADLSDSLPVKIFTSDAIKVSHPKYQKSNTAKWLIEIVSKTLAREAYLDYAVLSEFTQAFTYHYEQLIAGEQYNEGF